METIEAIVTRRSIRRFDATRAPEAGLAEDLLRAAMAAPSAGNQQPWRFVVVRDPVQRARLAATSPYAKPLLSAPLGFVVLADARDLKWPDYWAQDCSAAVQNLLLAAHAVGLGAVWLGVYPTEDRVRAVAEVLEVEDGMVPFAMVAVGYPEERVAPADRYDEAFVREDRWS